jgi:hypothetical protein
MSASSPQKHQTSTSYQNVKESPVNVAATHLPLVIEEVKKVGQKFGYHQTQHVVEHGVVAFTQSGQRLSISVYYNVGVVGICFDHPRQGRTMAFRKRQTLASLSELFQNPFNIPEFGFISHEALPPHGMNPMDEMTAYLTQLASLDAEMAEIARERQHLLSCIEDRERRRRNGTSPVKFPANHQFYHQQQPNLSPSRRPPPSQPSMPPQSPDRVRSAPNYATSPSLPHQQYFQPPPPPQVHFQPSPRYAPQPNPFPEQHQYHIPQTSLFTYPSHYYYPPPGAPPPSYHDGYISHYLPTAAELHEGRFPTQPPPPPPPPPPMSQSYSSASLSSRSSVTAARLAAARNTLAALELAHAQARNQHQQFANRASY